MLNSDQKTCWRLGEEKPTPNQTGYRAGKSTHSLRKQRLLSTNYPGQAGVRGHEWADRLTSTAAITTSLQLGKTEMLRSSRNFLNTNRPKHYSTDRLKEGGVEKESGQFSTLRGRGRSALNQTNIDTAMKTTTAMMKRKEISISRAPYKSVDQSGGMRYRYGLNC